MGEVVRTIAVNAPIGVVYGALKEYHLSPLEEQWRQGLPSLVKSMLESSLSKDVPNSELVFTSPVLLSKVETRYMLRAFQESATEITVQVKCRLTTHTELQLGVVQVRDALRMLEYGYKSGKG